MAVPISVAAEECALGRIFEGIIWNELEYFVFRKL